MTQRVATLSSTVEGDSFAWLDGMSEPVQGAVASLFHSSESGRTVKNWLNGVPWRHRVHPALIVWPLGAWTTAAFLDMLDGLAAGGGRDGYRRAADASIAFGIAGALPSALAGMADWVDTDDHPRRVGMAHALFNGAALALYAASLGVRLTQPNRRGIARLLAGFGFGSSLLGGALGGELVYTLGVNVPYQLFPKPADRWVDVLDSAALKEGEPTVVEVDRVPVLLLRRGERVYAVEAWCQHAGGPLGEGKFDGEVVECPWHQSRFRLSDGCPLQGPATVPLRVFAVREQAGRLAVRPSYEGQSWPPAPAVPAPAPAHGATRPAIVNGEAPPQVH
jgi:nitrite reductase/ring-hydroxylating ferredoxin subunit/uncharacterized membrane protein